MIRTQKIISILVLFLLLVPVISSIHSYRHGDTKDEVSSHYHVPYSEEDISMQLSLSLDLGDYVEYNVSVVDHNSSMTLIVEVADNSGDLWGVYIENRTDFYAAKQDLDPRTFCSFGLGKYQKLVDHVSYYAVVHFTRPIGNDYVMAIYNTHFHDVVTSNFEITILKGYIGEETTIFVRPADSKEIALLISVIMTGLGAIVIGLIIYLFIIRHNRKF